MPTLNSFQSQFIEAEFQLLAAIRGGSADRTQYISTLDNLFNHFDTTLLRQSTTREIPREVLGATQNLERISSYFSQAERRGVDARDRFKRNLLKIFHRGDHGLPSKLIKHSKKSAGAAVDDSSLQEETRFRPCRDFFLAHLGSPYPSSAQKKDLASQVGCTVPQINQWFTNYRRRVGWLDVMKTYAQDDKNAMMALVESIFSKSSPSLSHSQSRLISDAARQAVLDVKAKVTRLTMPNVSEAFREALLHMEPMSEEQLVEFSNERKAARRLVTETAALRKVLEERKRRKEARAQARTSERVAGSGGIEEVELSRGGSKRKRNDHNENENEVPSSIASAKKGEEEPQRRIKRVRLVIPREDNAAASDAHGVLATSSRASESPSSTFATEQSPGRSSPISSSSRSIQLCAD